jgi:hypothetical protein
MGNDSKLGTKIKAQLTRYCEQLSNGMNRPARRFFKEMAYGILASEDVKLSNVARALAEEIPLIKTEGRLSRQISLRDWTKMVNERLVKQSESQIDFDTVLAIDLMDVSKKYAQKMEGLRQVWDGSEGKIAWGYQTCAIVAAEMKQQKIIPIYHELFSSGGNDYKSENDQILKAVDAVHEGIGPAKGIYVLDRAGDRKSLLEGLLERGVKFVTRAVGTRNVEADQRIRPILQVAGRMRCPYAREVTIETKDGIRETKTLHMGVRKIELKFSKKPMALVVIKGWSKDKPMMLLTNLECHDKQKFAHKVLEIYLTRWKCEESFRFIKQSYHLEDLRVRSLVALRNTVNLLHVVFYFISAVLGQKIKLNILLLKICQKAVRFFEIPSFKQYAIADGIYRVLYGKRFKQNLHTDGLEDPQTYLPLKFAL